jgi:hypothetical protein
MAAAILQSKYKFALNSTYPQILRLQKSKSDLDLELTATQTSVQSQEVRFNLF